MILINLILFLQNLFNVIADNCDINNGYVLCENTNTCIQPYLTPCKDYYTNCEDCLNKQRNGISIACPNSCNTKITNIDNNNLNNCNTIIPICNYNYVCPKILSCQHNNINNYITYILKLTINSNVNIFNIYALYGDENNIMSIPPAYQSGSNSFGTNIGGIPNNIIRILPDSEYDSYLTLGITDGNVDNKLSSVGIDFDNWNENNGLIINDGAVFSLEPNERNFDDNEIIIAQLTLHEDLSTSIIINVRGKLNDIHNTWTENNIIFNIERLIPENCEIWFDGCNSCLTYSNICTELECNEFEESHCLRFNTGH